MMVIKEREVGNSVDVLDQPRFVERLPQSGLYLGKYLMDKHGFYVPNENVESMGNFRGKFRPIDFRGGELVFLGKEDPKNGGL